jgi:hypothetical protein
VTTELMVEVSPGRLKPVERLTRQERRRAERLMAHKIQLGLRRVDLLTELGAQMRAAFERTGCEPVDGPAAADIPMTVQLLTDGTVPDPPTLAQLKQDIKGLQAWIDQLRAA